MNLDKFNLNLFVALDAVLHAASLTEAARTLHLTQPALSIALKKLRETYGDEIVIYSAGAPVLTPLGDALKPRVNALIQAAKDAMKVCPAFDPASARHDFTLMAPPVLELVYLQSVLADVFRVAPGVSIGSEPFRYETVSSVLNAGVDLMVISDAFADPRYSMEPLFSDSFKCVVWEGHRSIGDTLSAEQFMAAGHVDVAYGTTAMSQGASHLALRRIGQERRVALRASSHAALPHLIVGTDLVATTLSRYADWCAQRLPVRVLPFPFEIPPAQYVAQWQPYRDSDPALVWLRDRLQAGVRRLTAPAPAAPVIAPARAAVSIS